VEELRVRVLGPFEVEGVPPRALGSRKGRTLLKLLALGRGRPVSTDRIVEALWGDTPPARPVEQVQVLVSRLRGVLGADRLVRADQGYRLRLDWLDVAACEQLVDEAERRVQAGSLGAARVAAAAALELARGALLADEPDPSWAATERAAAERLVARARQVAAEAALAAGDPVAAVALAAAGLDHDPYDEVALRTLMAAHARAGRPASALAAYARARARLAEDLGVSPTPATEALHTAILLGNESPLPPTPPAAAALAGRDAQLGLLGVVLDRVATGRGELVEVTGEAGIGKSLLVTTWAAAVRDRAVVLTGTCDELARSLPLQAVFDALESHMATLDDAGAAALLGAERATLGPLLGRAPPVEGPAAAALTVPALNPHGTGPAVLYRALVNVLARLSASGPVVLVIDDVHLGGDTTTEFVGYLARRLTTMPVLAVVTQRTEEAVLLPATTRIALGPLDLDAVVTLVGADRAPALHARSGGHPLLLSEIALAPDDEAPPTSLRAAVVARCERAGSDVAATLKAAAVLGEAVDFDLLASVTGASPVVLLAHLEDGARRMILEERGVGFAFRHALVREALASATTAARRALLHREAARALARRPRTDPLAVARHARLGGDTELAAVALADAAVLASGRDDDAEADRLLGESILMCDTARARAARARVRTRLGALDLAEADATAALTAGGGAEALEALAWVAHYRRDFTRAGRLADDGARLATDPALQAACLMAAGYASHCAGDLETAERRFRAAGAASTGYQSVVASMWRGCLLVHRGDVDEGLRALQAARAGSIGAAHAADHDRAGGSGAADGLGDRVVGRLAPRRPLAGAGPQHPRLDPAQHRRAARRRRSQRVRPRPGPGRRARRARHPRRARPRRRGSAHG
jgi:DNA-binding SARP family transcriptional activator